MTLDRPSDALLVYSAAVCEALEAVSLAASVAFEAVDSNLAVVRPMGSLVERRRTARDTAKDMIREEYERERLKERLLEILSAVVGVQWIGTKSREKNVRFSEERGKDSLGLVSESEQEVSQGRKELQLLH